LCALIFSVLGTTPALALPIIFTDRAAFDAAAGDHTLLTLDAPDRIAFNIFESVAYRATYQDLITFTFDYVGGVGVQPGYVVLGVTGLAASGSVLQPVTAFGFDITSVDSSLVSLPLIESSGFVISLTGLQFLGLVSHTPFVAGISNYNNSTFAIDNLAIQSVPEPSTLWLLGFGLAGLVAWHARQRKTGTA
jgi:hypothetical protein